jgi:hypothetical protein
MCFLGCRSTLEFDQVFQYELSLDPNSGAPTRISGLCGRSAYCVRGITSEMAGSTLTVLVSIGSCEHGDSGSFSYPLQIGDDIKELDFGSEKHVLWRR